MRVNQVMSQPVVTAPVEGTASLAARLMWEYDCGIIPLVDREGRLAGVITDRDLCMAAYTQGRPLGAIPVASAMAPHVVACRADETIAKIEQLMRDNQVRRVPVVDEERRPVGIVSMNDLARVAAQAKRTAADHEVTRTLAAVSRPRIAAQANSVLETPAA
jgi:CBS domain-containing protein